MVHVAISNNVKNVVRHRNIKMTLNMGACHTHSIRSEGVECMLELGA